MIWLKFIFSAGLIVFSGIRLTRYADILSEAKGLGKVWVGAVLLGLVTSLPEAVTSLASVISVGSADLAVGNIVGSNNFNPVLLVLLDIVYRKGSVTNEVRPNPSHALSARFANLLMMILIAGILWAPDVKGFGPVGPASYLIVIMYFWGMRRVARADSGRAAAAAPLGRKKPDGLGAVYLNLAASALAVVLGAVWLAQSADGIATETGLGRTFVGTFFLGLVTSLPEMIVTISALKLGSLDLAIGNIFGSNMINVTFVFLCDLVTPSPILGAVSPVNLVPAVSSILMVTIAREGLRRKGKKIFAGLGWDSYALLGLFLANVAAVYLLRR